MSSSKSGIKKIADPNARGAQGRTPLHRAAREGRLESLKALIALGANIHLGDETGEQPLQMAARRGNLECVECLIAAGADVNYIPSAELTSYSETALCSAARKSFNKDHTPIIEALLRAGADPNLGGEAKRYPLHAAAMCAYPGMVIPSELTDLMFLISIGEAIIGKN